MKLGDVMGLIPQPAEQQKFLELGRQYCDASAGGGAARGGAGDQRRQELLDRLMEHVHYHFRAVRHPMPTREQLEGMVREHFGAP